FADFVRSDFDFGHQNVIGTTCDTAITGDPACVSTHNLADMYAVMRFSGGVQAIDCLSDNLHRRVKSERKIGSAHVIVDGGRNTDDVQTVLFVHFSGDAACIFATKHDQRIEPVVLHRIHHALGSAIQLERIGARSAQNRAAALNQAIGVL